MGVLTPPTLSLDALMRLARQRAATGARRSPAPYLPLPPGMTAPLGCDAVAVPAGYGRSVLARLPRVGCVYTDGALWWWIVPSDSDVALEWPAPAHYTTGSSVPDARRTPALIHVPDGSVPYTPPIPLYLALCRVTGTTPVWSRPVTA